MKWKQELISSAENNFYLGIRVLFIFLPEQVSTYYDHLRDIYVQAFNKEKLLIWFGQKTPWTL